MKRLICMLLVLAGLLIAGGCAIAEKSEPCDICYVYQYETLGPNTLVAMCAECHKLYYPCKECQFELIDLDARAHGLICVKCGMGKKHFTEYLANEDGTHTAYCNEKDCEFQPKTERHEYTGSGWCPVCLKQIPYCGDCTPEELTQLHYVSLIRDGEEYHVLVCKHGVDMHAGAHRMPGQAVPVGPEGHECLCEVEGCTLKYGEIIPHNETVEWKHDDEGHWGWCYACGYSVPKESHTPDAENKSFCAVCQAKIPDPDHPVCDMQYIAKGYLHYQKCSVCGNESEMAKHAFNVFHVVKEGSDAYNHKLTAECIMCEEIIVMYEGHYATCNGTTCEKCGLENVACIAKHSSKRLRKDENTHSRLCVRCKEIYFVEEHERKCDGKTCVYCGIAYTGENVVHNYYSGEIIYDEEGHWYSCACGARDKETAFVAHTATCLRAKFGCDYCESLTVEVIEHRYNEENGSIQYDSYKHWYKCDFCSKIIEEPHEIHCSAFDKCWCGHVRDENTPVIHDALSAMTGDGEKHWQHCETCLQIVGAEHQPSEEDPMCCGVCGLPIGSAQI